MLISHEHKFIVGLPTKCGTNSMRNMALTYMRTAGTEELQEVRELRHRLAVPEGCEGYQRAMVIRNPFSRVTSMYEYLRRNTWEWKYKELMEAEVRLGRRRGWTFFLNMLIDEQAAAAEKDTTGDGYWRRKVHGRRPYIWTDTLSAQARFLGAQEPGVSFPWPQADVRLLKLESLANDWDDFARSCDWFTAPVPKKANVTRGEKLHDKWNGYFATDQNRHLGFMFVGEDVSLPYVSGLERPELSRR